MIGNHKSALNILRTRGSMYLRFPTILLLFAAIPLAASLSFYAPTQLSAYYPDCQPSMQNTYPAEAASGHQIVITTTITNVCISSLDYTQILVDIALPKSSVILSSAVAAPVAVNKIKAPPFGGPWILDVVVSFNDYPLTGTLASFQNTIIINIVGPLAFSTTKSSTRSTAVTTSSSTTTMTTSSVVKTTNSTTSSPVVASSTIPSLLLSTTNTSTSSSSSTSLTPLSVQSLLQGWNGLLILASVVVILLSVVVARIRRRKTS